MADAFQPSADDLLANNRSWAATSFDPDVAGAPTRHLAVVACMDCRLDVNALLGLGPGEAHVIRNAGGVVTDDVIRSVCLSQRYLGTREVVLVHHTDCGLQKVRSDEVVADLERDTGVKPTWSIETFDDPVADVRQSIRRLALSPFVAHKDHIRGFVYDVGDGLLHEVEAGQG